MVGASASSGTVASAACAASQGLWTLVVFRGLQAVGAAALTPTSLGLLLAATPDAGKVRAVSEAVEVAGAGALALEGEVGTVDDLAQTLDRLVVQLQRDLLPPDEKRVD